MNYHTKLKEHFIAEKIKFESFGKGTHVNVSFNSKTLPGEVFKVRTHPFALPEFQIKFGRKKIWVSSLQVSKFHES